MYAPPDLAKALWDIEQIKQLKARYFRFLDTKRWAAYRTCLTDDFRLYQGGNQEPRVRSGDECVAWAAKILPSQAISAHHGHMPEIELTSATTAKGVWAFFSWTEREDGNRQSFSYYHEEYQKGVDGKWRIKSSRITRIREDEIERRPEARLMP